MKVQKITIEMHGEDGRRAAIDHDVDPLESRSHRGRKITLQIGFETITMPLETLLRLLQTVDTTEKSGSEYPEDWKGFYGLAPGRER
jgi:hypothetical protein